VDKQQISHKPGLTAITIGKEVNGSQTVMKVRSNFIEL